MKPHGVESEKGLWIVFALLLLLVAFNSYRTGFNVDEFEAIHTSWKVLNTGSIYTDFFQHHHPLLYFLNAPVIAIVGDNIATLFVLRGMALFMLLAVVLVTYIISKRLFDHKTALLSVVLLVSMRIFIHRAMEVRPDTPQVLFGLISILFLFSFYDNRNRRDLIFSSVALAISFIFLQKAILLIFVLGVVMLVDIFRRDLTLKDVFLYSIVFIISLVPFYAYVLATGEIETYIFLNWKLNLNIGGGFTPLSNVFHTLRRNTLVWAFYLPGIWLVMKSGQRSANRVRLVVLSLTLLASVLLASHPNPQYFMHSIPLISILAAYALTTFFSANPRRLLIIVIIGTIIPAFAIAKRPFKKPNTTQIERVRYALSITDKTDRVHDPDRYFNLFREDIDFFWFHDTFKGLCDRIEKDRPMIIADMRLDPDCPYIKRDYRRSERYNAMYVRTGEE